MTVGPTLPTSNPLPCSKIVYRALARKNWVDRESNRVMPAAFLRRPPPQDDDGLSVDVESANSCERALRTCFGVVSLHVGSLRDLGLDVEVDDPPHANIKGLSRPMDDAAKAEWQASQLARHARLVSTNRDQKG